MGETDFINDINSLDTNDPDFLKKLELISQRVAESRLTEKKKQPNFVVPEDPQDLLNCEGCQ